MTERRISLAEIVQAAQRHRSARGAAATRALLERVAGVRTSARVPDDRRAATLAALERES